MSRLKLDSVTLCAVDTRTPLLALAAMQKCLQKIQFADAVLFSPRSPIVLELAQRLGVRVVEPGPIGSIEAYSRFMLQGLLPEMHFSHVLVVQWDGFVLHPDVWTDEFLQFDYIGALWPASMSRYPVGNGGFSLRSVVLLKALATPDLKITHPEDLCICEVNREFLELQHGVRFAPPQLAERFAYEHLPANAPTLGFHGVFNLVDVLSPQEMQQTIGLFESGMFFSAGMRTLAKRLMQVGQYDSARRIVMGRIRGGDRRWRTISLLLRMSVRKMFRRPRSVPAVSAGD